MRFLIDEDVAVAVNWCLLELLTNAGEAGLKGNLFQKGDKPGLLEVVITSQGSGEVLFRVPMQIMIKIIR